MNMEEQARRLGGSIECYPSSTHYVIPIGKLYYKLRGKRRTAGNCTLRVEVLGGPHPRLIQINLKGACCHPHIVSHQLLCLGATARLVRNAICNNDLVEAVSLIRQLLEFPSYKVSTWHCKRHKR